jgi:ubiquinone/menaquinone biosynthesis C-methylase UbiE
MSFYRDRVYPRIVSKLGNPKPIDDIRRQIIPLAHGEVLEIGVGPGVNFAYYDPDKVSKVFALEPNQGMLVRAARELHRTSVGVQFIGLPGENVPLDDASVDCVISTFTMCTIPDLIQALRGVNRVLKPGGQLLFFEHGLSPDPDVQKWQKRMEPCFKFAFEGCHLTRHIPSLVADSGLTTEWINEGYLAPFPKSATYCYWGMALRASRDQ